MFSPLSIRRCFPGIDAEERGQSEAIGRNVFEMAQLETPIIITTIIGEGGWGGARRQHGQVLMLQYAVYSVDQPRRLSSILWKTSKSY